MIQSGSEPSTSLGKVGEIGIRKISRICFLTGRERCHNVVAEMRLRITVCILRRSDGRNAKGALEWTSLAGKQLRTWCGTLAIIKLGCELPTRIGLSIWKIGSFWIFCVTRRRNDYVWASEIMRVHENHALVHNARIIVNHGARNESDHIL